LRDQDHKVPVRHHNGINVCITIEPFKIAPRSLEEQTAATERVNGEPTVEDDEPSETMHWVKRRNQGALTVCFVNQSFERVVSA
jgi:hypothetical protein